VGDLPMTLARCCGPARPQAIMGYVTLVRGVTIHRGDCASLARMRALKPERVLRVEWTPRRRPRRPGGCARRASD
jgi:GTP pyrophosphokinase